MYQLNDELVKKIKVSNNFAWNPDFVWHAQMCKYIWMHFCSIVFVFNVEFTPTF